VSHTFIFRFLDDGEPTDPWSHGLTTAV
jgi:hypothetical protein